MSLLDYLTILELFDRSIVVANLCLAVVQDILVASLHKPHGFISTSYMTGSVEPQSRHPNNS